MTAHDPAAEGCCQCTCALLWHQFDHTKAQVVLLQTSSHMLDERRFADHARTVEDHHPCTGLRRRLHRVVYCLASETKVSDRPGYRLQAACCDRCQSRRIVPHPDGAEAGEVTSPYCSRHPMGRQLILLRLCAASHAILFYLDSRQPGCQRFDHILSPRLWDEPRPSRISHQRDSIQQQHVGQTALGKRHMSGSGLAKLYQLLLDSFARQRRQTLYLSIVQAQGNGGIAALNPHPLICGP